MEFLQEMAISHGSYFNPAYMNNLHLMPELSNISMDAPAIHGFPRPHTYNGLLVSTDLHHFHPQLAEGMDETTLLQPAAACTTSTPPHLDPLNPSSLGLCTNVTSRRQQFCEISNVVSTPATSSVHIPCKIKRRSWQETISCPLIQTTTDISTTNYLHSDINQVEFTSVDNILNLHHIQAAATNHSNDPNYITPSTLTTSAARVNLPLEESLIAAHEKGIPAPNPNKRSFLSALSQGDEAFFKQQLLVPMEGCTDDPIKQGSRVFSTDHEGLYDQSNAPGMKDVMQNGFDDHNIVLQPNLSMAQLLGGHHHQESSVVTDLSRPSNMGSKSTGLSCAHANMTEGSKDNDEKLRARQDSTYSNTSRSVLMGEEYISKMCQVVTIDASRSDPEYVTARHHVGVKSNKAVLHHPAVETNSESKKRSLAHHDSAGYMAHSKRAHLGPHVKDLAICNIMRHSSSSTSLNMADSQVVKGTLKSNSASHSSKTGGKSSVRNPLGPALNTNLKPRARQGTANDPQTIAARNRRERINARLKVLQELVPNGSKVDLVTMLEKAINYVKFLQLQLRVLSNDEFWQAKEVEKVALQHVLSMSEEDEEGVDNDEDVTYNSAELKTCDHTSTFSICSNIYVD